VYRRPGAFVGGLSLCGVRFYPFGIHAIIDHFGFDRFLVRGIGIGHRSVIGHKDIIGQSYDTSEALFLLVVFYALILIPISVLGTFVEGRFVHGR
jgi:hypothetical protein